MRSTNRVISVLLALLMAFSVLTFSGCGKKPVTDEIPPAQTQVTEPAADGAEVLEPASDDDDSEVPSAEEASSEPEEKPEGKRPEGKRPVSELPAEKAPAAETPVTETPAVTDQTPVVQAPETPAPAEVQPAAPEKTEEKSEYDVEVVYTKDGYLGKYPIIQENDTLKMVEEMVEMSDGVRLYTRFIIPKVGDKLPIVFERTPYDRDQKGEHHPLKNYATNRIPQGGYIYVYQNSRGTGNSEGVHTPYGEQEGIDGYETLEYLRTLDCYNGEIFLKGHSYHATSHYLYLDREGIDLSDVKGGYFEVQTDRMLYRDFRNGVNYSFSGARFWLGNLLKREYQINGKLTDIRPYRDFSVRATGKEIPELIELYYHDREDDYWRSRPGYYAADNMTFPVMFVEGWYDYYVDGMFSMWERLPEETREKSIFVVGPWEHGTTVKNNWTYKIENGSFNEYAGLKSRSVAFFDSIRNGTEPEFAEPGKITYYSMGAHKWQTSEAPWDIDAETKRFYFNDNFTLTKEPCTEDLSLTYKYDPEEHIAGFSAVPGKAPKANGVEGRKSFTSEIFEEETDFYGKIRFKMDVSTDCEDTAFCMRAYFVEEDGTAYNLSHTAAAISYFYPDYKPGEKVTLDITFPYSAFTIKKGGAIRIDVSSYGRGASGLSYIPHANVKGHWAEVTETKVANNTLHLKDAFIEIPVAQTISE